MKENIARRHINLSISKKQIRESLILQLEAKGADIDFYKSLIDDYIYYWDHEKKMQADVRKRGLTYETVAATGRKIEKENPCVKTAYMYNKQKLAILDKLGLSTEKILESEDDDEL